MAAHHQEQNARPFRYPDQSIVNLNDSFSQAPRQAPVVRNPSTLIQPMTKDTQDYGTMDNNSVVFHDAPSEAAPLKSIWPSTQNQSTSVLDSNLLKQKCDELEAKLQKDNDFFEKALEARTDQLEAKEEEIEKLAEDKANLESQVQELHGKIEQMEVDHELAAKERLQAERASPLEQTQQVQLKSANERLTSEIDDLKMALNFEKSLNEEKEQ
jgi:hypothetical protein